MTTKLERIKNMEEELAKLKAEVEVEEKGAEWPQVGDRYWYVNDLAETIGEEVDYYTHTGGCEDIFNIEVGNCFRTKEEAERERDRRILLTKMRKAAQVSSKSDGEWLVRRDYDEWSPAQVRNAYKVPGVVYFGNKIAAAAFIDEHKDELHLLLED